MTGREDDVLQLQRQWKVTERTPLAQAVVRRANSDGYRHRLQATNFDSITGGGVRATVDGQVVLIGKANFWKNSRIPDVAAGRELATNHQSQGATVIFVAIDNLEQ